MAAETNDININGEGDVNKIEIRAENQQAEKILNVGVIQGGVTFNTTTIEKKEIKPANKFLCKNLIEAIKDYSPNAKKFLDKTIDMLDDSEKETWETQDNYLRKAKDIITSSFASVLGQFLSNLIACEKQQDYFDLSLSVTKRTLQLLCYSFISSYWDQATEKKIEFAPEQEKQLRKFFGVGVEPNISFYADLLKTLITIFQQQQLNYPIPEIKTITENLNGENVFFNACKTLDGFRQQFGKDQSLPAIDDIEKTITSFLVSIKFMAAYKMVSVKNIGYESPRNYDAQYVHAYTVLGVNNIKNSNGEKYQLYDKPISTDSVLLYKERYVEGLNLFPFVIDVNALKNEGLTKICFYACSDDKTLTYLDTYKPFYQDINDSDEIIEFNKEMEDIEKDITEINKSTERDISELKADNDKKYKILKMYEVYKTFQLAKQTFFGDDEE